MAHVIGARNDPYFRDKTSNPNQYRAPKYSIPDPEINIRVSTDTEAGAGTGTNSSDKWTNSFKARLAAIKKRLADGKKQKMKAEEEEAASGDDKAS